MELFGELFGNVLNFTWQQGLMVLIGFVLIYLAIKHDMEPALLLPMGFGAVLVNLPFVNTEAIETLFNAGIASELFPLLLFIGIGAMIDFGPLLSNPKMFLFGAAAQFGIFFTLCLAMLFGFDLKDAASISIIGAADGPTSIYVANYFKSNYQGPIMVAAYSYMALVPIVQPPVIRAITTKKERMIRMPYQPSSVSKGTKIIFPIFVTIVAGTIAPKSAELIGFLMFGNLVRECGVLDSLSASAQKELANLITLLLGISVAFKMKAELFVTPETLLIIALGLVAFVFDTVGGVLFAKFLNLFSKNKVNPMIGAAAMSLSSFCVVMNALRLNFVKLYKKTDKRKIKTEEKKMTLKIKGMMCNHCKMHVEEALAKVEGVTSVKVNLEKGEAEVCGSAKKEALTEAVKAAGYEVTAAE